MASSRCTIILLVIMAFAASSMQQGTSAASNTDAVFDLSDLTVSRTDDDGEKEAASPARRSRASPTQNRTLIGKASADARKAESHTGRVFIIDGEARQNYIGSVSVEIFDARRSLFLPVETATNLPSGRFFLGAAAVGNYVYAIGGSEGMGSLARTERLDVANPRSTWQTCAPMPTARTRLAVASSSKTIFAIGGWNGDYMNTTYMNTLEAFDTTTQTWNANLRGMPTARAGVVAGVIGDFLYAAGGFTAAAGLYRERFLNVVEKYQISTNEWSTVAPMPFNRGSACAAVLESKFYAIGGHGEPLHLSSAEVYTPSTNTWSRIADMSTARAGCGAAAVGGLIYVFGGSKGFSNLDSLDSVEVYNATTDSWHTLSAKMKVARQGFGIATIFDA